MITFDAERAIASATREINRVGAVARRAADVTPALAVSASELEDLIQKAYDTESSPSGAKWKPLAASTLRKTKPRAGILNVSGRLRNSHRVSVWKNQIRHYNTSGYFDPHQRGDRKRTPPQPPQRAIAPFVALGGGRYRLMSSGPALVWSTRMRARIKRYIVTGRV